MSFLYDDPITSNEDNTLTLITTNRSPNLQLIHSSSLEPPSQSHAPNPLLTLVYLLNIILIVMIILYLIRIMVMVLVLLILWRIVGVVYASWERDGRRARDEGLGVDEVD